MMITSPNQPWRYPMAAIGRDDITPNQKLLIVAIAWATGTEPDKETRGSATNLARMIGADTGGCRRQLTDLARRGIINRRPYANSYRYSLPESVYYQESRA